MPDDRLADVTIRHDALFGAAGSLSVSAGALSLVYTGSGPEQLMQLLCGSSGGSTTSSSVGSPGVGASGGGVLRSLCLSGHPLRFEAVPAEAGWAVEGDAACEQQPAAAAAAAPGPTATAWSSASAARQDTQLGDPQQPEQQQMAQQPQHAHSCDGAELLDFINSSEWATVWEVKLQRSMFRDQETLVLTRREPVSPMPLPTLAATPATL
jgi:hypothetical protein